MGAGPRESARSCASLATVGPRASVADGVSPKRRRYSAAKRPRWANPNLVAISVIDAPCARCKQCLAHGGKTQLAEIRKRRVPKESHEMTLQRAFRHFAEPGELRHPQRMRQRSAHIGERKSDIAWDRDARGRPGYLPIAIWRHGLLRRRLLNASSTNGLTEPNKHRPRAARTERRIWRFADGSGGKWIVPAGALLHPRQVA